MKLRARMILLGAYDLILASVFVYTGIMMLTGQRVFAEYPKEWLAKLPFEGWLVPGIIAMAVFGAGNVVASAFSFRKAGNCAWIASVMMGGILLAGLICQMIILGEWYLPTMEFLILCIIQLCLSIYDLSGYRKYRKTVKA